LLGTKFVRFYLGNHFVFHIQLYEQDALSKASTSYGLICEKMMSKELFFRL